MPSRQAILRDITDLNLNPRKVYRKTGVDGRLKDNRSDCVTEAVVTQAVVESVTVASEVAVPSVEVDVAPPVFVEPEVFLPVVEEVPDIVAAPETVAFDAAVPEPIAESVVESVVEPEPPVSDVQPTECAAIEPEPEQSVTPVVEPEPAPAVEVLEPEVQAPVKKSRRGRKSQDT